MVGVRAGGLVDPDFVESVSDSLYRGEGWLFRQPDFLRFNAIRRHDAGADGPGFLAWLRLGLHRQLCSVCDQSGLRSVLRAVFDDDHDGDDSGVCDQCAVVAGLHAAVIKNYKQNYYVEDTQKDKLRGSFPAVGRFVPQDPQTPENLLVSDRVLLFTSTVSIRSSTWRRRMAAPWAWIPRGCW